MKRIYVSFFTTVTVALTMTLIAYIEQDSTFSGVQNNSETFN